MNLIYKAGQLHTKEAPVSLKAGQHGTLDFQFKAASDDEIRKELGVENIPEGTVAGWASTNELDHYGDRILNGAFMESIASKGLTGPRGIKFLIQHRADKPAGVITKLEQRDGGLWIEAELELKIGYVKDAYLAAKMQDGLNFSVGYRLVKDGFKFVDLSDKGGESYWEISKADLHEVSVVTFPGNDGAEMTFIKADGDDPFDTVAAAEKALVASGFAKSRNEAQRFTRWLKNLGTPKPPMEQPMSASTTKALDSISASLAKLKTELSS